MSLLSLAHYTPAMQARLCAISTAVSDETGVPMLAMTGRSRKDRIVTARHLAMAITRLKTNLSLVEVGELFNRDHGTVIHACRSIATRMEVEPETRGIYERITAAI